MTEGWMDVLWEKLVFARYLLGLIFVSMATGNNFILDGLSGKLGKALVFKKYKDKTVVSKYPNMKNIAPTAIQKMQRSKFAEAVAYAKAINDDPIQKAAYLKKIPTGATVFNFAMAEYMKKIE
jgi:hypothetical protein